MKLTKSKLKQIIKEELNEMSSFHIAGEDKALHLANKATLPKILKYLKKMPPN